MTTVPSQILLKLQKQGWVGCAYSKQGLDFFFLFSGKVFFSIFMGFVLQMSAAGAPCTLFSGMRCCWFCGIFAISGHHPGSLCPFVTFLVFLHLDYLLYFVFAVV